MIGKKWLESQFDPVTFENREYDEHEAKGGGKLPIIESSCYISPRSYDY